MKVRVVSGCALWMSLSAIGLRAQSVDTSRAPLPAQDTIVTAVVTRTLIARLTPQITAATLSEAAPRPWEFQLPTDSNTIRWPLIQVALLRALHGRVRTGSDTTFSQLTIRRVVFRRDSLVMEYDIGTRWRCGTTFKGSGTMFRAASGWTSSVYRGEPLVSVVTGYGDSGPC